MSFNQSAPTVPTVLNTSNCFVFGNTASGNALSVQQLGSGPVASFSNAAGQVVFSVSATGGITAPGPGGVATNTAIGASALAANTTGSTNTAIGASAMAANTRGQYNTAVGQAAMQTNTAGNYNTAVGQGAMQLNTIGANNTAVGWGAMYANTTGVQNTAIGTAAMYSTTGSYNTAVGTSAMTNNTTGANNTAVGASAMSANTTGQNNVAVGQGAMQTNTIGESNTAVGYQAIKSNTTGANNTTVGFQSLYYNTRGTLNTAIGFGCMNLLQSGSVFDIYTNSTGIGNDARVAGSDQVQCGNSSTSFYAYGGYNNRSDIRDKTAVRDTVVGLEFINKIRAVDFKWNYREDYIQEVEEEVTDPETGITKIERKIVKQQNDGSKTRKRFHHGVIAQEVKQTMDELGVDFGGYQDHTIKGGCDVLTIGYTEFVGPLIKAVQELSAQVTALEQSLSSAVATQASLQAQVSALQASNGVASTPQ
jgi:hypothetical protein